MAEREYIMGHKADGLSAIHKKIWHYDVTRNESKEKKITGTICGARIEEIKEPLMQEIRYLDKLVDELARGKRLSVVLRD